MDKNPQRKDEHAKTVKYPVGEQHGAVVNENDQFFKNPPNNLGLKNPEDQDRASDLIGNTHTEPVSDGPSAEEQRRVRELAEKLNK